MGVDRLTVVGWNHGGVGSAVVTSRVGCGVRSRVCRGRLPSLAHRPPPSGVSLLASGLVNTRQQFGAAMGLAVMTGVSLGRIGQDAGALWDRCRKAAQRPDRAESRGESTRPTARSRERNSAPFGRTPRAAYMSALPHSAMRTIRPSSMSNRVT